MTTANDRYYLGCPIWSNREWLGEFFTEDAKPRDFLCQYASVFNTVEGNSTFYGLPRPETVLRWRNDTPSGFRFCFKFPRAISHDRKLLHAEAETTAFFSRLEPLADRLGPLFLQLPPAFGSQGLDLLNAYLDLLPGGFSYAVEVRHRDFFKKDAVERSLNRMLHERGIDRVVFDTRALFSATNDDAATREAQRKKPRLPVHAIATGRNPMLRFVGHPELAQNRRFLQPWIKKLCAWIDEDRTPYVFTHMADDRWAPHLGVLVHEMLKTARPAVGELSAWPADRHITLF